ncbi:MAG: hypothetical protein M1127_00375, partial [Patescibacteria group bacterium]|nr:hypothetical protein [Patescibacteria group bacterium]
TDKKFLNVIIKADFQGSLEAVEEVLKTIPQDKIGLRIISFGVGDVGSSDIRTAETSGAVIFGFRVKIDDSTRIFSGQKKVKVKIFEVIYEMAQEVRTEMLKVLEPEVKRTELGRFEATVLFKGGKEQIVGGRVLEGEFTKNIQAEVWRDEEKIGKARIKNLQQDKKDTGKITKGKEGALLLVSETRIKEGDILAAYKEEREKGTL